jgi:hypothetical protein
VQRVCTDACARPENLDGYPEFATEVHLVIIAQLCMAKLERCAYVRPAARFLFVPCTVLVLPALDRLGQEHGKQHTCGSVGTTDEPRRQHLYHVDCSSSWEFAPITTAGHTAATAASTAPDPPMKGWAPSPASNRPTAIRCADSLLSEQLHAGVRQMASAKPSDWLINLRQCCTLEMTEASKAQVHARLHASRVDRDLQTITRGPPTRPSTAPVAVQFSPDVCSYLPPHLNCLAFSKYWQGTLCTLKLLSTGVNICSILETSMRKRLTRNKSLETLSDVGLAHRPPMAPSTMEADIARSDVRTGSLRVVEARRMQQLQKPGHW